MILQLSLSPVHSVCLIATLVTLDAFSCNILSKFYSLKLPNLSLEGSIHLILK